MDDGCPALKRRAFFHYPPYLDQHAVIGRWTHREGRGLRLSRRDALSEPRQELRRPKALYTDASMMEVLPDVDVSYDPDEAAPARRRRAHLLRGHDRRTARSARDASRRSSICSSRRPTRRKADAIRAILDRRADEKVARSRDPDPAVQSRTGSERLLHRLPRCARGRSVRPHREGALQEDRPGLVQRGPLLQVPAARQRAALARVRGERCGALPEGAGSRSGVPAHDPHRLPHDGTRLVREQGTG